MQNSSHRYPMIQLLLSSPVKLCTTLHSRLCMNGLLHMRIHLYHAVVQVRVVPHQNLRIPGRSHKDGVDAAAQGRGEDVADLQADKEGKGDDNGRVCPRAVIRRVGEDHVDVCKKRTCICDESSAHTEDR